MNANLSRIDTSLVDSEFLADVEELLNQLPPAGMDIEVWMVTCGWRDGAEEKAGHDAWLADPSKPKYTDPSNSAHVGANFPDGKARAVDVTLVRAGRDIWDYQDPSWRAFVAAVLAHPRLHGLDSIGDTDHAEKLHWQRDRTA
jgi:hypothetical protein